MKKAFWLSLTLVAVLGFSVANVFARGGGGGHGGGHHGGGHHGGGYHAGHHSHSHTHSHTGHHDHHGFHHHYHHSNWAHHKRPFSHGWYGRHGGTWGYGWGGWGWGNPWAISTFGATAAWLGLEAASPYYGNYGGAPVDNVLTSDEETTDEPTSDESEANDTADNAPAPTPEQIASASELAASGKQDPPKNTSFLPLGVFSIAPQGQSEASALVQLAVSKDGLLRGSYYDLLTDHDQPIRGTVNKKTQEVAFTFGLNGKVTFETTLPNLTQEKGTVAAHFENGKSSIYTLARYEKEPSETEAAGEAQETDADNESDSEGANDQAPTAEPQSETAPQ